MKLKKTNPKRTSVVRREGRKKGRKKGGEKERNSSGADRQREKG